MKLTKVGECVWEIPKQAGMLVPGRVYAFEGMLPLIENENALQQVANVAHLPGIVSRSMAMPDIHWGYGFPIGGVAATRMDSGVISPGGVGYDINCGVRLVRTSLSADEIASQVPSLVDHLFNKVPSGVGSKGDVSLSPSEMTGVLERGSQWAVAQGYGWAEDPEYTEESGRLEEADPSVVSREALSRGREQLGTLGSGNHFLEIQKVSEIWDESAARLLGIEKGQVVIMIHSGSRGLGYQICDDSLKWMRTACAAMDLPDRQLCCAAHESPEGRKYWAAMSCAANYGWANRQILLHRVRGVFEKFFKASSESLGMTLVYDVAHNIAKREVHLIEDERIEVCVHRKGATRAFGPGCQEVPQKYRAIGQPVIVPGSMGTSSYLLLGTDVSMAETFGSTAHGAGRRMSRKAAIRATQGRSIGKEMSQQGVSVRAEGRDTLGEEAPEAYKDIDEVVNVLQASGLSKKVARMTPLGCVKG